MNIRRYKKLKIQERLKFWDENPIKGDVLVKVPGIEQFKMYCDNDDNVLKNLVWTKFIGWEYTSLVIWNYLVNTNTGVILDIGSYSGIYSLIAGSQELNYVFAFDIQSTCIDRVETNAQLNNFNNIQSFNLGLGISTQKVTYFINEEYNYLSSIAGLTKHKRHNKSCEGLIENGDEYLNKILENNRVINIKVDVEGAELEVLKGLKITIQKHKPNILIEVNDVKKLKEVAACLPSGYVCLEIDDQKFRVRKHKMRLQSIFLKIRNYIFVKNEEIAKEICELNLIPSLPNV